MIAPADGRVVAIEEIYDEFVQGPAVAIDIFLSVFNVHVNRLPCDARVIGLSYRPGRFTNALRPAASRENEQLEIRLEETAAPHRPLIVRQIAGAIARRIVCWLAPGDTAQRGEALGMIKLGSRTELVLPREPGLEIHAQDWAESPCRPHCLGPIPNRHQRQPRMKPDPHELVSWVNQIPS